MVRKEINCTRTRYSRPYHWFCEEHWYHLEGQAFAWDRACVVEPFEHCLFHAVYFLFVNQHHSLKYFTTKEKWMYSLQFLPILPQLQQFHHLCYFPSLHFHGLRFFSSVSLGTHPSIFYSWPSSYFPLASLSAKRWSEVRHGIIMRRCRWVGSKIQPVDW